MRALPILLTLAGICTAQSVSTQQFLQMARTRSAGLEQALRDALGADKIQKGTAAAGDMGDFVFAGVWLQDGSGDLDNAAGYWPAANMGMANALKFKGYDYHFSFGVGEHNNAHGAAELPEALTWLWRDYDPAKKSQEFV